MKNVINSLLFSFFCLAVSGQSVLYNLAGIPESIKAKAAVIVQSENFDLKIESPESATLTVHKIFTVVNEDGKDALAFHEYSSKLSSLGDVEIKVYDANGKLREKHKKKDMMTTAVGEGLIDEGYVTFYPVTTSSYPITVELSYEQKLKSTLLVPPFRFIDHHEGVMESNYTARVPVDMGFRYKAFNTSIKPVISDDGNYKIYKWTVKDLTPVEDEDGAVAWRSRYPHIEFASDNFSYYGLPGSLSTWKTYGSWMSQLYKDLDILPDDRKQFFAQLVKDAPTEKEKIRRIYDYMQKNFRYVSIQLGIGGFKPFSATFTDQKKYGDCKALSNYMKAVLKSVGIKSYVALINSDYDELPVDPDFPSDNFNHVILCVPGEQDSTWLECTSSTIDFGELGTFTENKNALLITDDGGVLVPTPKSHSLSNSFSSVTTVTMANDLSALTETILTAKGEYRETMNDLLKEKKDDQKVAIVSYFGFKQPDDFELTGDKDSYGSRNTLKMSLRSIPEFKAGSKLFISPRIYKIWSSALPKSENRKFDFYFHFPFEKYDTTILKLPAGIKPDVLPKEKELKCDYGVYRSKAWYNEAENSIYSVASLTLNRYKIPVSDYTPVKKFFDDIMQDDAQKIVVKQ